MSQRECKQHKTQQITADQFECHDCAVDEHQDESSTHAQRKLLIVSILCVLFMIAEAVGGILAGSLAILTDAAHLLSDLAGFLISVFALWLTSRRPTKKLTYGFHRAEIIGALLSVFMIWAVTGVLLWEAAQRIKEPQPVDGKLMLIIATIGFVVNSVMAYVLHGTGHGHSHGGDDHGHQHGTGVFDDEKRIQADARHEEDEDEEHHHEPSSVVIPAGSHDQLHQHDDHDLHSHGAHGHSHSHDDHGHSHHDEGSLHEPLLPDSKQHAHHDNLNIRAAFIHVLGDMAQSLGVMIAAGFIWYNPEWTIVDPICTIVFAIIVLFTTFKLISESLNILMEGTPRGIDHRMVMHSLSDITDVESVHDLHIWSITSGKPALSVHIQISSRADHSTVLRAAQEKLLSNFNICHTTIQLEASKA